MTTEYHYRKANVIFDFPDGDVTQMFSIWNNFLRDANFAAINVNMGQTGNSDVEQYVLDNIGSYGRQLGRIGEALNVLIEHFELPSDVSEDDRHALEDFQSMLRDIARVKKDCAKN
ncbi:MAG: hypothetical protein AAGG69_11515 [Pseudomonadota bacterium]